MLPVLWCAYHPGEDSSVILSALERFTSNILDHIVPFSHDGIIPIEVNGIASV